MKKVPTVLDKAYLKVAQEYGLSAKEVERTYKVYWKYIRLCIEALPFRKEFTEEEFKKMQINYNIVGLGKLCAPQEYRYFKLGKDKKKVLWTIHNHRDHGKSKDNNSDKDNKATV